MSARHQPHVLLGRDEIVAAPMLRACSDRTFEMPPIIYGLTAAMFFGFVSVLSLAFSDHMLVSYGVIVVFLAAFFAVPALWVKMRAEENQSASLRWADFMESGITTSTGRTSGAEATVLVLLLPFLIFCWAVAMAAIATVV